MKTRSPLRCRVWLASLVLLLAGAMTDASMQRAPPPGRLSGVIVDADSGAPLRAVQVTVALSTSARTPVRAVTDAAGRYEVTSLPAGTYIVTASMTAYVEATFGRRHQIDTGGTIDVASGQHRTRVNFQLSRESILLGRVAGPDGQGLANLVVNVSRPHTHDGQRRLVSFASARSDGQGEAVTVEGQAIAEQTMTLKPGSDLSGAAHFDAHGTRPPADLTSIRIHAPLLDATGFGVESETRLQPDATFHLTSVDAGRMLVRVDGLPAPWSLAQVTQGGRDITDRPLDIVQGQKLRDLQVLFTDVVTGVTGIVRNHSGAPLVNYMVVVFPVNRELWRPLSRFIGATRTDWEGRYRLVSLPPGQYRVAAVNDFEEGEIHERDALDQISLRSEPAVLPMGSVRVHDLVVTIGQRSGGG